VQSALAQTFADFELIVVDDGSTDGGGEIVRGIGDPRIRLIVQENAGVSAARNRGVAEARSDLVAFLDADDEWRPAFLERSMEAFGRFPDAAAVFTNYLLTHMMAPAVPCADNGQPVLLDDYFRFVLRHGNGICSSSVVASRKALEAAGGFPPGRTMGEDLDTWFRLACVGKIVFVPDVLATYYIGGGVCSNSTGNQDVWESYQSLLAAGRIPPALRASAAKMAAAFRMQTILHLLRAGRRREARRLLNAMRWRDCAGAMGLACCAACYVPLLPRSAQWGMVRFAQKYL